MVVMRPPSLDPVCRMTLKGDFVRYKQKGNEYHFCSKKCLNMFQSNPEAYIEQTDFSGRYTLDFYDVKKGNPVLTVPVIFKKKEAVYDTNGHDH